MIWGEMGMVVRLANGVVVGGLGEYYVYWMEVESMCLEDHENDDDDDWLSNNKNSLINNMCRRTKEGK